MYRKIFFLAAIFFSLPSLAVNMESRMKLLQQMDMLDNMDFQDEVEAANNCIAARNFDCAVKSIQIAEDLSANEEQALALASIKKSLSNERSELRREQEEAHERRMAERRREERRQRELEDEEEQRLQIARLERQARNQQPSKSTAAMIIEGLDKVNADLQVTMAESQQNFQRQIDQANRNLAQSQQRRKSEEQAYQRQQQQNQAQTEQRRRDYARQQQLLSQQREAQFALQTAQTKQAEQKPAAIKQAPQKEKYQLVVESLAFCWQHATKKDHWRCRGPSHSKGSTGDATSTFDQGLLKQASYAGCSNASDNYKQAWSSGDKSGYVLHCQKALNESDADVANDYAMPGYIRVKRKIYKCNYPIQNNCSVYMQGAGDVASRRVFN